MHWLPHINNTFTHKTRTTKEENTSQHVRHHCLSSSPFFHTCTQKNCIHIPQYKCTNTLASTLHIHKTCTGTRRQSHHHHLKKSVADTRHQSTNTERKKSAELHMYTLVDAHTHMRQNVRKISTTSDFRRTCKKFNTQLDASFFRRRVREVCYFHVKYACVFEK